MAVETFLQSQENSTSRLGTCQKHPTPSDCDEDEEHFTGDGGGARPTTLASHRGPTFICKGHRHSSKIFLWPCSRDDSAYLEEVCRPLRASPKRNAQEPRLDDKVESGRQGLFESREPPGKDRKVFYSNFLQLTCMHHLARKIMIGQTWYGQFQPMAVSALVRKVSAALTARKRKTMPTHQKIERAGQRMHSWRVKGPGLLDEKPADSSDIYPVCKNRQSRFGFAVILAMAY